MSAMNNRNKDFDELIQQNEPILMVSLPENSFEFAQAAFENGADAIKLHLNVTHKATGRTFPNWSETRKIFERICEKFDLCVGVVPGDRQNFASEQDLLEMKQVGISFIDFFIDDAPLYVLNSNLKKMVALKDYSHTVYVHDLCSLGVHALELSIVPREHYGEKLTLWDLVRYTSLAKISPIPCFVPTEKRIEPTEVPKLINSGIKGLIIGPIVTGTSLKDFSKVVRSFKHYISNSSC